MKLGLDFAKNTTYEGFCKSETEYKIATKYDHSTKKLPEGIKKYIFYVNSDLTDDEIAALKKGFIPPNAEWKWFMYYESGVLNLYRSWTGKCIYRIVFGKVSQRLMVIYYSHE